MTLTPLEFQQVQERVARTEGKIKRGTLAPAEREPVSGEGEDRESKVRKAITDWCASRWPVWIAAGPRTDVPSTMPVGWPDLVVVGPKPIVLFCDLKSRTGKPSKAQLDYQVQFRALDHDLHFVRTFERFLEIVAEATETPPTSSPGVVPGCIDSVIHALTDRLKAKQPMYHPDAEWNALMQACAALRDAKSELVRLKIGEEQSK